MNNEEFFFNGVNGTTGDYLQPPLTPKNVSKMAQGQTPDPKHLQDLKNLSPKPPSFAPIPQVGDFKDLGKTGWGVIFPHGTDSRIKKALDKLLSHRQNKAKELYREYSDWVLTEAGQQTAYFPGETANQFLARFGANSSNPVDPKKVPYYLLIVGNPEAIPYSFQYQLDVQYAVGRIYFEMPEEYARYAQSVVLAETSKPFLKPKVRFVGAQNHRDPATKSSSENLVKPLARLLAKDKPDWDTQTILDQDVTKTQLGNLLGGIETPALLFTASHGVGFNKNDSRQLRHQGSLLVSEGWCKGYQGPIPEDWYFSADDLSVNADKLLGIIVFHFACFGAGTPKFDDFGYERNNWEDIAPHAFVARLPQKLLSHEKGGALAVIGHIDRAWGYSFGDDSSQLEAFQSTLFQLMDGYPVGVALEYFNQRYAALSSEITHDLDYIKKGMNANDNELSRKWMANNDARGYGIIGDPSVRLVVSEEATERPVLEKITLQSAPVAPPSTTPDEETGLKQAQVKLIQSLEDFLDEVKKTPGGEAGKLQTITLFANSLLQAMKTQN